MNADVVITGLLDNVFVVSGSMNGVTVAGPDTNSDSLTVKVTALEVTVVASALDKTQRNCSDGIVGNDVAGVVYDAVVDTVKDTATSLIGVG